MLTFIGFITKDMYYTQNKEMISPELKRYTLPLTQIDSLDINRRVQLNEETGEFVIESLKDKGRRMQMIFLMEKEDARPIISIDRDDSEVPKELDEDEIVPEQEEEE